MLLSTSKQPLMSMSVCSWLTQCCKRCMHADVTSACASAALH